MTIFAVLVLCLLHMRSCMLQMHPSCPISNSQASCGSSSRTPERAFASRARFFNIHGTPVGFWEPRAEDKIISEIEALRSSTRLRLSGQSEAERRSGAFFWPGKPQESRLFVGGSPILRQPLDGVMDRNQRQMKILGTGCRQGGQTRRFIDPGA